MTLIKTLNDLARFRDFLGTLPNGSSWANFKLYGRCAIISLVKVFSRGANKTRHVTVFSGVTSDVLRASME